MVYSSVPSGHQAVPLHDANNSQAWRVAVLLREANEGVSELVMLNNLPDARAYLGCLLDGGGMVRLWLEIWVQNFEGFIAVEADFGGQYSSEQLDRRWQRHWKAVRDTAPATLLFEVPDDQLRPLYLDVRTGMAVRPTAPDGAPWILCRDDQRLAAMGLPQYSQSTWRYLEAVGPTAGAGRFVAVDKKAPAHKAAPPPSPELGFDPSWLPLNPQGGHLSARVHPPLDFGDYADLLSGATVAEVGARKREGEAAILHSHLTAAGHDGRHHGLLLGHHNGAEIFYLKLRLLLQAGRGLFTHLQQNQCPLLNLDPASFGVFPAAPGELPWPWTTTCELIRPGRAFPLAIPGTTEARFVAVGSSGGTAYCPGGLARRGNLNVTIRIDQVISDEQQRTSIEGRITTTLPVQVASSDLVRFRLSEGSVLDDFFGTIFVEGAESREEIGFRTWPQAMTSQNTAELEESKGGSLARCFCEFIPALSSPYDLYSLSVLGARVLLSHKNNSLSKVVGELECLGRAAGKLLPSGASLKQATPVVERLLEQGAGTGRLSIQHLFGELPDAAKLSASVPPQLWAEAIALLLRLTPGLGSVSQCADFGPAPGGGLQVPLEEPISALEDLCARTRSLVFSDWNSNQEVRKILAGLRDAP